MKLKNVKIENTYKLKSNFDCACLGPESEATHPGTDTVTVIGICAVTNQVKVKETNDWMPVEWLRKMRNKPNKVTLEELLAPFNDYEMSVHDSIRIPAEDSDINLDEETFIYNHHTDCIYQAYKAHQQEKDEKLNKHLEYNPISIEYMSHYGPLNSTDREFYYFAMCEDPKGSDEPIEGTGDTPEEALRDIIENLKEVL